MYTKAHFEISVELSGVLEKRSLRGWQVDGNVAKVDAPIDKRHESAGILKRLIEIEID